ncbi:DUF3027 domain-containing protein [Microbacterium sp. NPDC055683]
MTEPADPGDVAITPDARLLAAHGLALAALAEVTPADTVGPAAGYAVEPDGVVSLRFENRLAGYPGWYWTVSLAVVEGSDPTVLEVELLPGEAALLAPEWVPWSVRLEEYKAAQAAALPDDDDDEDEDESEDDLADESYGDDDEDDESDDDLSGQASRPLHAGDVDGVDIDELDADERDDEERDDEE